MRYLHAIAPHETFIGSGTYHYILNGAPSKLVEHWTIHELPDGARFLRADEDSREVNGRSILSELWRNPVSLGGEIGRADVYGYGGAQDAMKTVRVTTTIDGDVINVGRTVDKQARTAESIPYSGPALMRLTGMAFLGLSLGVALQDPAVSIIAHSGFADLPQDAFRVGVQTVSVRLMDEETIPISGRMLPTRRLELSPDATVWLDGHDTLVRYESPTLLVELVRYAHRQ